MAEAYSHPAHYNQGGIECIEAIRACLSPEEFQGFCRGNVLKYAWRYKQKGGVDDLNKAQTYLFWLKESYAEQKENDAYIEHYKNRDGAAYG